MAAPKLTQTARDIELFAAVARALSEHTDTSGALERVLALVAAFLGLDTGWVWLLDLESERFYLAASYDLPPYLREPVQMTGEQCWCIEAYHDGDFVSKNVDVIECSRLRKAVKHGTPELTGGHKYHASVALKFGDRQLGIMNLSRPNWHALSEHELQLLAAVGAQIGLAVERARLADEAAALARAQERTRLAREIHDTLAQDLTAIALQLENALRRLAGSSDQARERIETALAVTRQSLEHARASVLTLRVDPLGGKPLAAALASLVRGFTSESGILAVFHDESSATLGHAAEIELFRIASEALSNVRRHAQAHRVEVRLADDGAAASLRIEDDGVGYPPSPPAAQRYGVVGMAERAGSLGGTLAIGSSPNGRGTVVEARIPLRSS